MLLVGELQAVDRAEQRLLTLAKVETEDFLRERDDVDFFGEGSITAFDL
jgi:hypothetical protein